MARSFAKDGVTEVSRAKKLDAEKRKLKKKRAAKRNLKQRRWK